MTFSSIIEQMPQELQLSMFKFAEALEEKIQADMAVRRQDIDALRDSTAKLVQSQADSENRLERVEAILAEVMEGHRQSEQRLTRLEVTVKELAEAQKRTEQRVEELAEAQKQTEIRLTRLEVTVGELAEAQKRTHESLEELRLEYKETKEDLKETKTTVGDLLGDSLERTYRDRIGSYLGSVLRKVHVFELQQLADELEQHLSAAEMDELWPLDLLVRGQVHALAERPELWLAIEISNTVDQRDVTRAQRRAELLRKAGYRAIPAVAGAELTEGAEAAVTGDRVLTLRKGIHRFWDEALARVM
ncbi:hypothetical protein KFU94_66515 [Chloroflexi bacterium TSY]|nr:hypothetical protein [Chloroflexi bacterium TSY]